jgi:hypothetical protein
MTASLASVTDITSEAAPASRYPARVLASTALSASTTPAGASAKIRGLFAGCAQAGYAFPSQAEAAVMAELAALANGAA